MSARGGWIVSAVALALIGLLASTLFLAGTPGKSSAAAPSAEPEQGSLPTPEPPLQGEPSPATSAPRNATSDDRGQLARAARACGSLEVTLVDFADSERPVAGVVVAVVARDMRPVAHLEWSEASNASGIARFPCVEPGALLLVTNRACGEELAVVQAGKETKLSLSCAAVCALRGRVLDAAGRPAGNVELRLVLDTTCGPIDLWLGECDNSGRFEFAAPESGRVYARGREHAPSTFAELAPCATDDAREIELRVQAPSAVLLVQLLAGDDQPVEGAIVRLEPLLGDGLDPRTTPHAIWNERADLEGRVALRGLDAGTHLLRARAHGFAAWTARIEIDLGSRRDEIVRLQPGGVIAGRATSPDGSPAAFATVQVGDDPCDFGAVYAITATDGSFRIADVPAGLANLHAVGAENTGARARLKVAPNETTSWNPELASEKD